MGREDLYVAMTRGRHLNHVYAVIDDGGPECLPGSAPSSGRAVLDQILATSHAEPSATETWETWHQEQPTPALPPRHPQRPWTGARPQQVQTHLTGYAPPSADGPVISL